MLAIDGGRPVRTAPMPAWPHYTEAEIARAAEVLRSGDVNYWTGKEGRCFEAEFAAYIGRRFAVALANGTVALELALRAAGVRQGDEVIVTPRSFVASVSTVIQCGAVPIFADIDKDSQNISASSIASAITSRTKAVLLVHLAGWPCDIAEIDRLIQRYKLTVIEDCAQAHGASYRGNRVGSFGDAAAFSFCQDKIMTTCGEGGMLVTDDENVWKNAWAYKDHGKSFEASAQADHTRGYRWLHQTIGSNFRMTEIQSAVGRMQLRELDQSIDARQKNARYLTDGLRGLDALRIPEPDPQIGHAYYKYYVFVEPDRLKPGWSRDRIMESIVAEGVPCSSGSCPEIYREKAIADLGFAPREQLPVAAELGETSLMFPVHPTLQERDLDDIRNAVTKVLSSAAES